MKKLLALIFSVCISLLAGATAFAQNATPTAATPTDSLSIVRALADEPRVVTLSFSEPVDIATVRVTVENPLDRTLLMVSSYTGGVSGNDIRVLLSDNLHTSTTYKLTINSAIAQSGKTINAWVDAIREFVTPAQFMQDGVTPMNAAANTSAAVAVNSGAVIANTGAHTTVTTDATHNNLTEATNTGMNDAHTGATAEAKELPATGTETIFIVATVMILATTIMALKRRKA